jgi:hypothetical protein
MNNLDVLGTWAYKNSFIIFLEIDFVDENLIISKGIFLPLSFIPL